MEENNKEGNASGNVGLHTQGDEAEAAGGEAASIPDSLVNTVNISPKPLRVFTRTRVKQML